MDEPRSRQVPWALDASWQALRRLRSAPRYDVAFFHTQTVSLFAPVATRAPFVVSVDATPVQLDGMGRWYGHARGSTVAERLKRGWYAGVFHRAAGLVAWSDWAARSLVQDYGVPPGSILVAHPGARREFFALSRTRLESRPSILFVGGDFERKGGDTLLEAFASLQGRARLILVTTGPVGTLPGVEVVSDATPGSSRLLDAYARADIFCLPTKGDCTPVVLGEAMAAGLPVVTTRVGSNPETVRDGYDGYLVEPGDAAGLNVALGRLVDDPARRWAMGQSARSSAARRFDAEANASRVFEFLERVAA
jgi:glycosyltransferase involved in cell wall biosynthesis